MDALGSIHHPNQGALIASHGRSVSQIALGVWSIARVRSPLQLFALKYTQEAFVISPNGLHNVVQRSTSSSKCCADLARNLFIADLIDPLANPKVQLKYLDLKVHRRGRNGLGQAR
jgi:hypothetical protein